jgi:hypothetical protein
MMMAARRFEYEVNGKSVSRGQGRSVVLEASLRFHRNNIRLERRVTRLTGTPERLSVQKAMLAIEDRIVKAFWVLARLPNDKGIGYAKRNGLDYLPEREDRFANAVAAGGKWDQETPRPAVPSGREIDAMYAPLEWLRLLDREHACILSIGAQWKRGESCRRVSWPRARERHTEFANYSTRTLQRRYNDALRTITVALTQKHLVPLARQ